MKMIVNDTSSSNLLKQMGLHRKQNPLSWATASLNWSHIHWTQTFPKSSWSLDRKLCHVVARTIINHDFCKILENAFFIDFKLQSKSKWYLITRTKLIILFLSERKRNLLSAVASTNTSTTIALKQLVQLNSTFFFRAIYHMSWKLHT